jgi:hypothetical protein
LQQAKGSLPSLFSDCRKQMEVAVSVSSVFHSIIPEHGVMDMEMETRKHGDIETSNGKRKTEAQAIFLNLFTTCSSCIWNFVVCPFVDKETNGSYPIASQHSFSHQPTF